MRVFLVTEVHSKYYGDETEIVGIVADQELGKKLSEKEHGAPLVWEFVTEEEIVAKTRYSLYVVLEMKVLESLSESRYRWGLTAMAPAMDLAKEVRERVHQANLASVLLWLDTARIRASGGDVRGALGATNEARRVLLSMEAWQP